MERSLLKFLKFSAALLFACAAFASDNSPCTAVLAVSFGRGKPAHELMSRRRFTDMSGLTDEEKRKIISDGIIERERFNSAERMKRVYRYIAAIKYDYSIDAPHFKNLYEKQVLTTRALLHFLGKEAGGEAHYFISEGELTDVNPTDYVFAGAEGEVILINGRTGEVFKGKMLEAAVPRATTSTFRAMSLTKLEPNFTEVYP